MMMLRNLIDQEPALRDRAPAKVPPDVAETAEAHLRCLAYLYDDLWVGDYVPEKYKFPHSVDWQLAQAVKKLPDVCPIAIALVRESYLSPDDAPGETELRAKLTVSWLRRYFSAPKGSN